MGRAIPATRAQHRRRGVAVPGRVACRRAARWLVEDQGWVIVLHPAILLLGLAALLVPIR